MSTPKLISPLLDNFMMGDPISDENGVRCCPAMNQQTQEKYFVKIISVPASQTKLEALLLTGAYPNAEAAGAYFKQQADEIAAEADILKKISRSSSFEGFEAWQVVPMDDGTGYDVYLLYPYRKTLEKHCQTNAITHLEASNMALDICAALASCRNQGYLFLNLRPENILLAPDKGYRIGDLGLLPLNSLKYASIPERYFSPYTAPELTDAFSEPNETVDTYALGMVLYQIYNGGVLPFDGERATADALPAPAHANADLAEIILKACAPDPADRWQTPAQMGQALIASIQRNGISDTPIVVLPTEPEEQPEEAIAEEVPADAAEEVETSEESAESIEDIVETEFSTPAAEDESNIAEEIPVAEDIPEAEEIAEEADEAFAASIIPEAEEAQVSELTEEEITEEQPEEEPVCEPVNEDPETNDESEKMPEEATDEEQYENLSFLDTEEAQVSESAEPVDIDSVLSQVDALLADIPDIEEAEEEPNNTDADDEDEIGPVPFPYAEDEDDEEPAPAKKRRKGWIGWVIAAVILIGLIIGGYFFYTGYYLQPVNALIVDASKDVVVITVDCPLDSSELRIVLTDERNEKISIPLTGGKATISGLKADMTYTVTVEANSFHKLTGKTSATFETLKLTEIQSFTVVTGNAAGTAELSFQVTGPDSERWIATFIAADGTVIEIPVSDHSAIVEGLNVGTEYSVTLRSEDPLYLAAEATATYVASDVIVAEELTITHFTDAMLSATWAAPVDTQVSSWTVLCTNGSDFRQVQTVTEPKVTFGGIDHSQTYTIAVTANNQSVSAQAAIQGGAPTITGITANATAAKLVVSWNAPDGNWIVEYRIIGTDYVKQVSCTGTSVTIMDAVPGQTYKIAVKTADGVAAAHPVITVKIPDAVDFTGYTVSRANMQFRMCKTPSKSNWSRVDLKDSDYTTSFTSGQKASFLIRLNKTYNTSPESITSLFVIKNAEGTVVHTCSSASSWTNMWYGGYCELDIPSLPAEAGSYTITVYFNGAFAYNGSFTITN